MLVGSYYIFGAICRKTRNKIISTQYKITLFLTLTPTCNNEIILGLRVLGIGPAASR